MGLSSWWTLSLMGLMWPVGSCPAATPLSVFNAATISDSELPFPPWRLLLGPTPIHGGWGSTMPVCAHAVCLVGQGPGLLDACVRVES